MAVLENLEPKQVFAFFEQICAIPHGSGNTKAISDYLADFARTRALEYYQDALNNVIIVKEATVGYEDVPAVMIQGHMDMVCEQAPDCTKDMEREGLDLVVDGDTIYAKGTTLGGDDGIAVAMALAVLDAEDLPHPRIEAVFTVDEETGMDGATELEVTPLRAKRMLNIDSEVEGVLTVGCAGGNRTTCKLPFVREAFEGTGISVVISGLQGGHSGIEIHKGGANANMLLGRLLYALREQTDLRICAVQGGLKDNAIPVRARAELMVKDANAAERVCAAMEEMFRNEYRVTDPDVAVTMELASVSEPLDALSTERVICLLTCVPNGVQVMSPDMEGLVQTSLNMGVLDTDENAVSATFSVRSSVATQKTMLVDRLRSLMNILGGTVSVRGDYPGWQYQPHSPLRDLLVEVFRQQYGREPMVVAIHAGLECGLFLDKIPDLDCVSFGPDLTEIHTFRERMHIASVQRTWMLLKEVLCRTKDTGGEMV